MGIHTLPNEIIAIIFGYVGVSTPEETSYLITLDPKATCLKQALNIASEDIKEYIDILNISDDNLRAQTAEAKGRMDILLNMYLNPNITLEYQRLSTLFATTLNREVYDIALRIGRDKSNILKEREILWDDCLMPARDGGIKRGVKHQFFDKLRRIALFLIHNFSHNVVDEYGNYLDIILQYGWFDIAELFVRKGREIYCDSFYGSSIVIDYRKDLPDLFKETVTDNLYDFNNQHDTSDCESATAFIDQTIMSCDTLEEENEMKAMLIEFGVLPKVVDFGYNT